MIYPDKIGSFLKKHPIYIPYKIFNKKEHLKNYRRYWLAGNYNEIIKVIEVYTIEDVEYYFIKVGLEFFGSVPYPVKEIEYELVPDKKALFKREDIINDGKYYTGAEIKFWFFIHPEKLNKYYKETISFLDMNSANNLRDTYVYTIVFEEEKMRFITKKNYTSEE